MNQASASQPTVFIVDDEPAVRGALSLLLKSAGLKAQTYDSAQAFLEAYNPKQKGCLVLDVRMPGMGGIELQEQLTARQIHMPVILLTGYADVPMAIHAFKAGAFDLIEKPFDNEVLLKRIKEAMTLDSEGHQESELAFLALASMGDGVITTDSAGAITYLNPTAEQLTGWLNADARGKPLQEVFTIIEEISREPITNLLSRCFSEAQPSNAEDSRTVLIRRDGQELPIQTSLAPIRDQAGDSVGAVILFQDATQARDITRLLSYQATHDPLTGVINRREFERRLERVLHTRDRKSEHTLCYLDLDRFKVVNDTAGHAAGDELLRQVSALWSKRLRQRDTLARLGGDEFAVLLEHCPLNQGIGIAHELLKATQDLRFGWEDNTFSIGVSIGVTAINPTSKTIPQNQVLQLVDAACYAAKKEGRNRIHVHYPGSEGNPPSSWVAYLDQALREERMQLFHQSIAPAAHEQQQGHYQILLRMQSAGEEAVTMGMFLPTQERAGLAPVLDQWVIRQVLKWLTSDPEHLTQSRICVFNVSRHSFEDKAFPDFLNRQMELYSIAPHTLCFAFGEATLAENPDRARRLLHEIKSAGYHIAVDDFASTPSGFFYLKYLPVDFLKIDARLIRDVATDPIAVAIVKSTNDIAHTMGIQTIAKGVDNASIRDALRLLQVDYLQGYAIAKPVRLEA